MAIANLWTRFGKMSSADVWLRIRRSGRNPSAKLQRCFQCRRLKRGGPNARRIQMAVKKNGLAFSRQLSRFRFSPLAGGGLFKKCRNRRQKDQRRHQRNSLP